MTKILTVENPPYDLDRTEEIEDIRYCVLDYRIKEADYIFVPCIFRKFSSLRLYYKWDNTPAIRLS